MEDIAGDESFEDEERLFVAELVEERPEIIPGRDRSNADGGGHRTGLKHVRAGHGRQELPDLVVVEYRDEVGYLEARLAGLGAHRELVPEMPGGGVAHARDPEMLADHRGLLDVEVVERHDPVDLGRAS